jgi:hypothetical protein
MKYPILLLILFLLINFVSASPIEVEFFKDSYFAGETVQAEIYIENLDYGLDDEMITFSKNNSFFPINPNLIKLSNDHYFIYFDLNANLESGDYDLNFNNIIYRVDDILSQDDFEFHLNVQKTNDSILTINPGIIKVENIETNNNFNLYISNKGNESILASLIPSSSFIELSSSEVNLNSGLSEMIYIYLSQYLIGDAEIEHIELIYGDRSYSIPIWFKTETVEAISTEGNLYFAEDFEFFNRSIYFNESIIGGYLKVKNSFNFSLEDIVFSMDDSLKEVVNLEVDHLDVIEANENFKLYIDINENKNVKEGKYEGYIYLKSEGLEDSFLVIINILPFVEEEIIENEFDEVVEDEKLEEDEEVVLGVWFWAVIFLVFVALILYLIYIKKKPKKKGFPFSLFALFFVVKLSSS